MLPLIIIIIFGMIYFINELRYHKFHAQLITIKNRPYKFLVHDKIGFQKLKEKYYKALNSNSHTEFTFGFNAGFVNSFSSEKPVFEVCHLVNSVDSIITEGNFDERFFTNTSYHCEMYSVSCDKQYLIDIVNKFPYENNMLNGYYYSHLQLLLAKPDDNFEFLSKEELRKLIN